MRSRAWNQERALAPPIADRAAGVPPDLCLRPEGCFSDGLNSTSAPTRGDRRKDCSIPPSLRSVPAIVRRTPARRVPASGPSSARRLARVRINSSYSPSPSTSNQAMPRSPRRERYFCRARFCAGLLIGIPKIYPAIYLAICTNSSENPRLAHPGLPTQFAHCRGRHWTLTSRNSTSGSGWTGHRACVLSASSGRWPQAASWRSLRHSCRGETRASAAWPRTQARGISFWRAALWCAQEKAYRT